VTIVIIIININIYIIGIISSSSSIGPIVGIVRVVYSIFEVGIVGSVKIVVVIVVDNITKFALFIYNMNHLSDRPVDESRAWGGLGRGAGRCCCSITDYVCIWACVLGHNSSIYI
jgi:hypothetical protein